MRKFIRRLRWRVARLSAPEPIMFDPRPGDGAFVVQRSSNGTAWIALDRCEVTVENAITPKWFGEHDIYAGNSRRAVKVIGSAGFTSDAEADLALREMKAEWVNS